ncbi:MAG: 50S ribosomal protein L29 [Phycisphaerales bacterium]|jgi:ribosomal protein L29
MKAKEVHGMDDAALKLELAKLRNDLFDVRSQAVTEKVEDTSKFAKLRKDIARLETEASQRRIRATAKA